MIAFEGIISFKKSNCHIFCKIALPKEKKLNFLLMKHRKLRRPQKLFPCTLVFYQLGSLWNLLVSLQNYVWSLQIILNIDGTILCHRETISTCYGIFRLAKKRLWMIIETLCITIDQWRITTEPTPFSYL